MKTSIGKQIYQLRKERNISQAKLAEQIGATQKAVDFWEKEINEPKASFIVALCEFFGVSADFLLGLEN